ncbi:beta-galactosidase/beta-glucuronidase [Pedobacter sp. UYEF25]
MAVRVDHSQFADSRWYTGSGINRNVSLIAGDPVHVKRWGIAFSTPIVFKENASAIAKVSIQNQTSKLQEITLKVTLTDRENKIVSSGQAEIKIGKNKVLNEAVKFKVEHPELWSVDYPNLYQLSVKTYVAGKDTDNYTNTGEIYFLENSLSTR